MMVPAVRDGSLGDDGIGERADSLDFGFARLAGFEQVGRVPEIPTPPGVPVEITSPGKSVMFWLM
jgi:hypothetical protein